MLLCSPYFWWERWSNAGTVSPRKSVRHSTIPRAYTNYLMDSVFFPNSAPNPLEMSRCEIWFPILFVWFECTMDLSPANGLPHCCWKCGNSISETYCWKKSEQVCSGRPEFPTFKMFWITLKTWGRFICVNKCESINGTFFQMQSIREMNEFSPVLYQINCMDKLPSFQLRRKESLMLLAWSI